jgi:branched-chain amino acid aminotransferase
VSCIVRLLVADPNGGATVEPVDWSAASLAEAASREPTDGVYGVFCTQHGGRVVRLTAHLERLLDSARRVGIKERLSRNQLRQALAVVFREAGFTEARFRITLTHDGMRARITAEPFAGPPADQRAAGIQCATVHVHRNDPRSKTTAWLHARSLLATAGEKPDEYLLLDDRGRILEGASSNFYLIAPPHAESRLITASDGVLYGIARSIVLEAADGFLPVELRAPSREEAYTASEAFISSASRGIIPAVSIDGIAIGTASPGPLTRELTARYERRAVELEEPLERGRAGATG